MTLNELTEMSADELEKFSNAQLLEFFKPFLSVTRPELAPKQTTQQKTQSNPMQQLDPKKRAALEALAAEGIDLGFLKKRMKR